MPWPSLDKHITPSVWSGLLREGVLHSVREMAAALSHAAFRGRADLVHHMVVMVFTTIWSCEHPSVRVCREAASFDYCSPSWFGKSACSSAVSGFVAGEMDLHTLMEVWAAFGDRAVLHGSPLHFSAAAGDAKACASLVVAGHSVHELDPSRKKPS